MTEHWQLRALGGLLLAWMAGAVSACTGTEHAVFEAIVPGVSKPVSPPSAPGHADDDAGVRLGKPRPPHTLVGDDDAGTEPDPGLDPTVDFPWKESLPGQGTCRKGRYIGSFRCTVDSEDPEQASTLSGALIFTLGTSGSPEEPALQIVQGQLSGPWFFAPRLSGKLECISKHFSAIADTGLTLVGDGAGGSGTVPALYPTEDATLDGTFDDQSLVIQGAFVVMLSGAQTCTGTFRASATP